MVTVEMPARLWQPIMEFEPSYQAMAKIGFDVLRQSHIAIVGLARNCAAPLRNNLETMAETGSRSAGWRLHIESNDCADETAEVLHEFANKHDEASFCYHDLGHGEFGHEFQGRRTEAMAMHRTVCQTWVRNLVPRPDLVVVFDCDLWGGWNTTGLLNGIGWLSKTLNAFAMSSVSLFEYDFGPGRDWYHYDLWALRGLGQQDCWYDTYQNRIGGWAYTWLPPVGSPPVLVSSAFGGLAVYRTSDYLAGTYDGSDCEHVGFHRSIAQSSGRSMYICPSMRTVPMWIV